jgi:cell division protein FtsX
MAEQMINLFGVLALFTGAFIIFNTFRTIIVERRRDIGMLRALGATRRMITGMILLEGLLQGAADRRRAAAVICWVPEAQAGLLLMGQFTTPRSCLIISPSILTAHFAWTQRDGSVWHLTCL